jgi:hypothetical protein
MKHEEIMVHAVTLAAAFIQNGDLRHDHNFRDDHSSMSQEKVSLLVTQMYRSVAESSFQTQESQSWAANPDPEHGNA